MKLISCYVENFGKLHDYGMEFTDGANVICQRNGWGKSTLVAFIRAMFYGLEGERKRNIEDNEWKRYTPWQGGVFGGRLTFEVSGKQYVVTRTFQGQEFFELRDAKTNLVSHDYSSKLGEELFHVDKASFMRTVFLGQADCETAVTDDINAKIGNLTENSNDLNSFEAANQRLKDLMNSLTPSRKTGSISKRKTEITELERKVTVQKELPNALQSKQVACAKERKSYQQRKEALQLAEQEQIRLSKLEKVLAKKEQWEQLKKECQRAREAFPGSVPSMKAIEEAQLHESEMQKALVSCNLKVPTSLTGVLLAVVGLILATVGVLLRIVLAGCVGVAMTLIGAALIKEYICRYRKWSQAKQEYEAHEQQVLQFLKQQNVMPEQNLQTQLVHMRDALKVYKYAMQQLAEFEKETDTAILLQEAESKGEVTLSQVNDRIRNMREQLAESERYLRSCQTDLERLQEQLEEWEEDELRLEALKEQQEKEQKKYDTIVKVQEYLTKAKEHLTNKYSEPILSSFCSYFQMLTAEHTERFSVDANTKLWINEQGKLRETNTQSSGLRDLIGICLRVALVDAMYTEELPVLIMDDPFTNLDDEKIQYAKKFLETVAEKYQVIYFTCSEARK